MDNSSNNMDLSIIISKINQFKESNETVGSKELLKEIFSDIISIHEKSIIPKQIKLKSITLPGLIDVHVHVREPGHEYKEDWRTCTMAALAGGITMIFAMPNTKPSVVDYESFELVNNIAKQKALCDYGLYFGANNTNAQEIPEYSDKACALKMYLNTTYRDLKLDNTLVWEQQFKHWNKDKPICVHAEGMTLVAVLSYAFIYDRHVHVCHISSEEEITIVKNYKDLIKKYKENDRDINMRITCEVSPHHLFLDKNNIEDNDFALVKPPLSSLKSHNTINKYRNINSMFGKESGIISKDRQALWDNLDIIDCFATDHAPHLVNDKVNKKCPGFPGLETALPLLLTAVDNGLLTIDDIILRYHTNPKKIFGISDQPNTSVEICMDQWVIPKSTKYTKCNWTPFEGMKVTGRVLKTTLRDNLLYSYNLSDGSSDIYDNYQGTNVFWDESDE